MKALITGANGAVGTGLRNYLATLYANVVTWNRNDVPYTDYAAMESYVADVNPDVLFHLATASKPTGVENEAWLVNYEWTSELAWITRTLGVRFVYTSSVMVFTDANRGPFTLESRSDALDGYGYEKRMAERRVFHQNPDAIVARLGWQIGEAPGSNNMIDFFARQMREHGQVNASRRWFPACSFITDTAAALYRLASSAPSLYMLDSNTRWNFYAIAQALNVQLGNKWQIVADDSFVYDQRMIDPRPGMPALNERLPALNV